MSLKSRYPGALPFEREQNGIFFGREAEIDSLRRKIKLVPLTVLYAKSGYGKSSLINAGLLPKLEEESSLEAIRIRFNSWQENQKNTLPLETARAALAATSDSDQLSSEFGEDKSLWRLNKEYYINTKGEGSLFLIFDQFEELFTYPAEAIQQFKEELAEVLFTNAPQRYWDQLETAHEAGNSVLDDETLRLFQDPPAVRVLMAIRSDRLHLLERLSDYIPNILKNLVELAPLDERQARKAITEPAIIKGDFDSPRYTYEPEALNTIISFLTEDGTEEIETTQLQIICNNLEQKIKQSGAYEIKRKDVDRLDSIIENYYEERISRIKDPKQAYVARKFIEEGLIFEEEERRLTVYEGQIFSAFKLEPETLSALVNSHLLRAETSLRGGYTYELSHDTLVKPILKAKKIRIAEERAEADRKAKLEQDRIFAVERRKRRRAYLIAMFGVVLALVALISTFVAYRQYSNAESARKTLEQNTIELSMTVAENFKVQGEYDDAMKILNDLILNYSLSEDVLSQISPKTAIWSQVKSLTEKADSLSQIKEFGEALSLTLKADSLSTDAFLKELIRSRTTQRDELVKDYLESANSQIIIGNTEQARQDLEDALRLDPDNQDIINALENLKRN